MNKVVEILMRRDGLTRIEAEALVNDTREDILNGCDDVEDIISYNLGLEPDYIFDII